MLFCIGVCSLFTLFLWKWIYNGVKWRSTFTDSQAAIKALDSCKFNSKIILECWNTLQLLSSKCPVTITWVPGHCGIVGNEIADKLARQAANSPFTGPEPWIAVSLRKLQESRTFKNHWHSFSRARQAKNCISINKNITKYFLSLSRKNLKRLTDILTGHCSLNSHLYTIGLINSPSCNSCGEIETAEHILCHCPAYITARARHLGAYQMNYSLIKSIHPKYILKFLNATNKL